MIVRFALFPSHQPFQKLLKTALSNPTALCFSYFTSTEVLLRMARNILYSRSTQIIQGGPITSSSQDHNILMLLIHRMHPFFLSNNLSVSVYCRDFFQTIFQFERSHQSSFYCREFQFPKKNSCVQL